MDTITVYGYSDDLIEVEGAIEEEFMARDYDEEANLLAFSDGTILRIAYTAGGVWRITPIARGNADTLTIDQAPEDDEDHYSDRATLTGDIRWVVFGSHHAVKAGA